jgi:hypothetical protein
MHASEVRNAFINCGLQLPAEISRSDMKGANAGEMLFSHSNSAAATALLTGPEKLSKMRSLSDFCMIEYALWKFSQLN